MRRKLGIIGVTLAIVAISAAPASADPGREAPKILKDPTADNTDVYAFTVPDALAGVTFNGID